MTSTSPQEEEEEVVEVAQEAVNLPGKAVVPSSLQSDRVAAAWGKDDAEGLRPAVPGASPSDDHLLGPMHPFKRHDAQDPYRAEDAPDEEQEMVWEGEEGEGEGHGLPAEPPPSGKRKEADEDRDQEQQPKKKKPKVTAVDLAISALAIAADVSAGLKEVGCIDEWDYRDIHDVIVDRMFPDPDWGEDEDLLMP